MMSGDLFSQLRNFKKDELVTVPTIVTSASGKKEKVVNGVVVDDPTLNTGDQKRFIIDAAPDEGLHEVTKGLFIGSQDAAANHDGLKAHGVTHILNVACYVKNFFPDEFVYKAEPLYDEPSFRITPYFDPCADFIHNALEGGGSVLCHCNAGISRSSSLILAYLMKWRNLSLVDGLEMVRAVRPFARPNVGFMDALKEYEKSLAGGV